MDKSALIIRNVSTLTTSEIDSIEALCQFKKPLIIDETSPAEVKAFQTKINDGTPPRSTDFASQQVRDYLFDTARANTGNQLILHLDHTREDAETYILSKLDSINDEQHISVLYLGGGHGGGYGGHVDDETSGLQKGTVKAIVKKLEDKKVSAGAAIFGSCYSAAFSNDFRNFLIDNGVMLSDSVECGHNGFDNLALWMTAPDNRPFYSEEDINAFRIKVSDIRIKFNEITGDDTALVKKHLVQAYADYTHQDSSSLSYEGIKGILAADKSLDDRIMSHKTDLFDEQVAACSEEINSLGPNPSTLKLRTALDNYPLMKDYVDNLLSSCVYKDDAQAFTDKIISEIAHFEQTAHLDASENISDDLINYLDTKFTTPHERNYLRIFKHLKQIDMPDTIAEYKDFAASNLKNYIDKHYDPNNTQGPQIKSFANADALFSALAVAMQKDVVTSKVVSTQKDSRLMELDESTGKPPHACEDAYNRVRTVIDLLQSNPDIAIIIEKSVSSFNQAGLMTSFNNDFSHAMEASALLQQKAKHGLNAPITAVNPDHQYALKDQLAKMKSESIPPPSSATEKDLEHLGSSL